MFAQHKCLSVFPGAPFRSTKAAINLFTSPTAKCTTSKDVLSLGSNGSVGLLRVLFNAISATQLAAYESLFCARDFCPTADPVLMKSTGVRAVMAMVWFIAVIGPVIAQAEEPSRACSSIARYDVVPMPFIPRLVTPSGVVAGITELDRAVVWHRKSGIEELGVPEGFEFTEPVAVMPSGEVLINAIDANGHKRAAFTYSKHLFVALAGKQTWAHGVGAPGMIVGEWVPEGGTTADAVYWSDAVPHSIGLCCGGILKAVNERGKMIGEAYDERGHFHAFSWSPSDGQHIIDPTDTYSSAVAINNAGHILLQVGDAGYLYDTGHPGHLDLAGKGYTRVQALNECDVVVGGYGPVAEDYHAFVWSQAQGFRDLDSFLPADSGWKLRSATAINDRGEIVGSGKWHGAERGFLLIPRH